MDAKIDVNLGGNRWITVDGTETRTGTETGNSSIGNGNAETYDVVIEGVACEGRWDGDGRHSTTVRAPKALRDLLLPRYERQQEEAHRRDREAMDRDHQQWESRQGSRR